MSPPSRSRRAGSLSAALAGFALLAVGSARAAPPAVDWALHCRGCHLADGSGAPGSVPDLRGSVGRFLHVEGGREFLVRVPGVATSPLPDDALAEVLNWMLGAFSPDEVRDGFEPYTGSEVGALRREPLLEVERVRAALLRAIKARR